MNSTDRLPPITHRLHLRLAGLAVVLVAAACAGGSTAGTTTTSTSTTTTSTTSTTSTTTTTLPPTTTTTTIPIVTDGALVLVANASGVDGAARQLSELFVALGFPVSPATNAAGNEDKLQISKIYFLPDGEAAANSIALLMGGIEVLPMTIPAWITGGSEALGYTTVLVILGDDLAGKPLPGLPD